MMSAAGLGFGTALLQVVVPNAAAKPTDLPTGRVEAGFRTCALQLTRKAYLTAKNAAALKAAGITFGGEPPADVEAVAARSVADGPIVARIASPEGKLWIAISQAASSCKRDLFVLNRDRPGAHVVVALDGPNIVLNDGVGTQVIMTVALDPAKAS